MKTETFSTSNITAMKSNKLMRIPRAIWFRRALVYTSLISIKKCLPCSYFNARAVKRWSRNALQGASIYLQSHLFQKVLLNLCRRLLCKTKKKMCHSRKHGPLQKSSQIFEDASLLLGATMMRMASVLALPSSPMLCAGIHGVEGSEDARWKDAVHGCESRRAQSTQQARWK